MSGAAWLASALAGWLEADWALAAFLVASVLLVVALLGRRHTNRLLNLRMRRDLAAARRSSEAVTTATAPLLHPSPARESAETARLRAHMGRYWPFPGVPLLVVFLGSYVLFANDILVRASFAMLLLSAVGLGILWVKVGSAAPLDAGVARDAEAHRAAVEAEAARTPAAPVLYLRSFADDGHGGRRHGALTEEEQLAKALAWVGPLLAVGRPGEELPHVGAQRIYVANEDWQRRVAELMEQARLVVLRTGSTRGFGWELERALTALAPERLLLVVDDRRELRAALAAIGRHTGRAESRVRLPGWSIATVKGLVMFGPDWTPQPLRLPRGIWRASDSDQPLVARFTLALRPLLDRFGVDYEVPGYSPILAIVGLVIALIVIAGIAELVASLTAANR